MTETSAQNITQHGNQTGNQIGNQTSASQAQVPGTSQGSSGSWGSQY